MKSKTVQSILMGAGVFAGLATLALVLALSRLASGPVSLGFLIPRIEEALTPSGGPYSVKLDGVVLDLRYAVGAEGMRGAYLRARGVKVLRSGDSSVLRVPEMYIKLSATSLLRGVVAPTEVEITNPSLHLVIAEKGGVGLRLGDGEEADLRALCLRTLTYLTSPASTYSHISIRGARVTIEGKGGLEGLRASHLDLSLKRAQGGLMINASLNTMPQGAMGAKAAVRISGIYPGEGKALALRVEFLGVEPAAFAPATGMEALAALKLPLEGSIELEMDGKGRVDAARFELSSTGGVVEPPIVPLTPSTVKNLYAKGYAHNSLQSLTLTDFYASVGTTKLSLSAHLTGLRSSPLAYVKAELKELSVDELKHHWQGRFLPHTYSWVQANILGGRVEHASIALTLRWDSRDQGIRLEAIEGRGEYLDGTCKCIASLPPLRDASGTISFTKDHFSAYVAKGRLGSITVGSGTTLITGISGKAPVVHITANVEGALKDAISIAKGAGVRLELPVPDGDEDIRGTFGATLAATFPMYKTPSLGKEMTIRADIKGAEANLSVPGGGRLSEGELELHVKTRKGEEKRTLTIKKALLQSPLGISGNVSGSVTLTGTNGTSSETTVLLDLNEASLAVPLTNWHKPPRVPANLTLRRIGTMGWEFKLLGNGLSVEGNTIASGTRFEQITFTRFLVGTTDVKGTIERDTDGAYEISIEGEALDGEHFLRSLRLGEGARDYAQSAYGSKPQRYHFPLRLTTKLGQATLGGDRQIKSVSARADYDGKRWRYITAHGTLKHGREIALEFTSDEVGSKLTLSSEDAGETLRLLDLYENINGGKLKLAANFDGKNGVKGKVVIEDYKLLKAPTLTRVLTLASLTGIVNLISGEGIEFKRLEAPFTKTGKTVEIKDAIAWGDSLGISAKHGLIQLDTGTLEFEGFVVPAYTLTRVVGLIPLLGKVITGGKLSGIIAVSYKLRGEIDNPNISVNPMSILTPGILKGFLNALEELARQHGARQ